MSGKLAVGFVALLATVCFAGSAAGNPPSQVLAQSGHWRRPSLSQELRIRVVDATNDASVHDAMLVAAAEWSGWSPDLELVVETGTCSAVWDVITPGMVCFVWGNPGANLWGFTLWSQELGADATYYQYTGVQVTLNVLGIPGAGDPALVWILAHELGHALGLYHADFPSIMYPWWSGQCCPTDFDLQALHGLYSHADPPIVRSLKPNGGRIGEAITINGAGLDIATSVSVNGVDAGALTRPDSTLLTFALPVGATSGETIVHYDGGSVSAGFLRVKN